MARPVRRDVSHDTEECKYDGPQAEELAVPNDSTDPPAFDDAILPTVCCSHDLETTRIGRPQSSSCCLYLGLGKSQLGCL